MRLPKLLAYLLSPPRHDPTRPWDPFDYHLRYMGWVNTHLGLALASCLVAALIFAIVIGVQG